VLGGAGRCTLAGMPIRRLPRRDFLRVTVVSVLSTGALPLAGCSGGDDSNGDSGGGNDGGGERPAWPSSDDDVLATFPQGIASGEPRPDSVILWTRVEPASGSEGDDIDVVYDVATDADFQDVVATGTATASASADHTLRLKLTDLSPFTTYYYRFLARGVWSDLGRTKTAPTDDADTPVRFAFATCQDFIGRYYHAWAALMEEDDVDFVVFLGDYIYETDGDPSFMTVGDSSRGVTLPDGLEISATTKAAQSLADYRYLYKRYRSDADLKRVHAWFPFFTIWDDHEFANDCWSDHSTHFNDEQGPEQVTGQRQDADQAWYEYQPVGVEYDESASYPDDIKIYRTRRYGKHMELFLTDERYYRDDHVVPEGSEQNVALAHLNQYSEIGSRIFVGKDAFDPMEADAKPTMLGATQKGWLIDALNASTATWKIWGSEVQLAQMVADLTGFTEVNEIVRNKYYLTCDQWDGYRTERAEILQAVSGVDNLVTIVGDVHAFYAAELHVDFDDPASSPVAVEYTVGGITSQAIASAAESVLSDPTFESLGLLNLIPSFDQILLDKNPHYKHANSFGNGIATCDLSADEVKFTFLEVGDVTDPSDTGVKKRVTMRTVAGSHTVEML
jgi:alkaline phosphatase D